MRILITFVFTNLVLLFGYSQKNYSLDTVQVSTAQIPLKISETGRNVTVVSAAQIAAMPANSIDEILQTVPGLEVQSRGGFGAQADILLRGSTFTQVLMLLDGMKMNDPLTAHFNGYIPVTPAEIERIEILRGPAAAMYGPDAVGGVINIITKTFSPSQEGTEISGALNYGQHKLVSGQQGFSINKGPLSIGGGFSMNQSEGEVIPQKMIDSTTTLDAFNTYFDIKTTSASFGYKFKNGISVRARSGYDYRDFNARYFYTSSAYDKSTETVGNWWNQMQILKVGNNSSTDFNVAYKYNTDEFIFSNPEFPNNHTSQLLNFTFNHLRPLNENLTLKLGGQIDQRQIESNDRGNHEDLHFGAYATGVYQKDIFNLSGSLRGDYDENYGFEISPQLNLSMVFDYLVLRASAGRCIRAADYTERYVSNNLQDLFPERSLGNPNLSAERSWSEEVGLDYSVNRNWQIKSTVFARQSSNLIDFVATSQEEIGSVSEIGTLQPGAIYFFAKNISDVQTFGLEIESWMSHKINENASLKWSVGYTLLNTSNEDDIVSVYISSHAKNLFTTQLILNINRFDLALNGLYKERNELFASAINSELKQEYMVWNARLGFKLTEDFSLNFQVQNLFNETYQNILGAPMPGRWLMGGIKWSL